MIRMFGALSILFLGLAVPVNGLLGDARATEKITFMLDWLPLGQHSAFYAARDRGTYREKGLDVTIIRGYGSSDTIKNVAANKAPIGFADYGSLVIARSRGIQIKGVGVIHDKNPHAVYVLKSSGIRKPGDLEGRSFAEAAGGAVNTLMPAFAKAAGIKSYKFVPVAPATKNAVLLSGKVDSMGSFAFSRPTLQRIARKSNKEVVEFLLSDYGIDIYSNGLLAKDTYLEGQGETLRKFVHATMKEWAWSVEHPDEAVPLFLKNNPDANPEMTRAAWDIAVDLLLMSEAAKHGIGHMTPEKWQRTIDIMHRYASLDRKVSPQEMYTNEFLPKFFPKRR